MRTTLTIDDEVYAIARQVAALKHLSVGSALSELARRGLERTARSPTDADFPAFEVSENAPVFGLDDVAAAEDEE
ncbi:MAG: hypothetical protein WCT14_11775 [Treponemataceae bacterium]